MHEGYPWSGNILSACEFCRVEVKDEWGNFVRLRQRDYGGVVEVKVESGHNVRCRCGILDGFFSPWVWPLYFCKLAP